MNKKSLVILPGWEGNKETWKKFTEVAGKNFEVQVIDLPCFGDKPCPETAWGVEEYVEFVKNKLSVVRSPKSIICLLGHSFGGQIAVVLASKYPFMIDRLILTAPAVFRPKNNLKRFVFGWGAKLGRIIFKIPWLAKSAPRAEEVYHQIIGARDYHQTSGIKREIFKKIIREDQSEAAGAITVPTLIVWGSQDAYLPAANARRLQRIIKNSKLEVIKNGRHGLHLQQPKKLAELIYAFSS